MPPAPKHRGGQVVRQPDVGIDDRRSSIHASSSRISVDYPVMSSKDEQVNICCTDEQRQRCRLRQPKQSR